MKQHLDHLLPSFKQLFGLAYPVVFSYLLSISLSMVNLAFIGHLSATTLAAAALGNMLVNVSGNAIILGLASCIDTLCAQAFGMNKHLLMGLIVQRALIFLGLCTIPIIIFWSYTEVILLYLGQEPEIAHLASVYVWRLVPAFIPNMVNDVLKKFLQAQQINRPMIYLSIVTNIVQAILCYLYIFVFDWGFEGAPLALASAQIIQVFLNVGIISYNKYFEGKWPEWCWNDIFVWKEWKAMMKLAVSGMFMLCLEWWCFEICSLIAGLSNKLDIDAFVVTYNIVVFMFMVPLGISISSCTLVGNYLGSGDYEHAKNLAHSAILMNFLVQCFISLVVYIYHTKIGLFFTSDAYVNDKVSFILILSCFVEFFDSTQGVCAGILRGAGLQTIGVYVNFIGYYILALPIGAYMCLNLHLGAFGLWIGLACAVTFTCCTYLYKINGLDWKQQSELAKERIEESSHLSEESNFAKELAQNPNYTHFVGDEEVDEKTSLLHHV